MAIKTYRREYTGSFDFYEDFRYDTETKAVSTIIQSIPGGAAFAYSDNTIVDVYQKTTTSVAVVTYSSLHTSGSPSYYLNTTIITGAVLLFAITNEDDSPVTLEFATYSRIQKQVTLYTYNVAAPPAAGVTINGNDGYLVEDWELLQTDLIHTYCTGFTLNQVYYDGHDDSSPPGNIIRIEQTSNSGACGYVAPVPDVVITEVKRIKIDHACYDNPVYLVWRNTLGGWDQWLFQKTQTKNLITEGLGSFEEPEYVLETSEGSSNSLGLNAGESLILGANNLTTNQYNAIRELLFSPKIYQVETDSSRKKVEVRPGSFSRETKDGFHTIEFEISQPNINTVKS